MPSVLQPWVCDLTFMQQGVIVSAVRGCDGLPKRHKAKAIVKWYRRCVLVGAFEGGVVFEDPFSPGGGSFTGPIAELPWEKGQDYWVRDNYYKASDLAGQYDWKCAMLQQLADDFVDSRDELQAHYQIHFMHAAEILGYKHPIITTRDYWMEMYLRLAKAYHLWPETEGQMDARLGDSLIGWQARNDRSSSCSD